jgi:hypothetical protein
MSELTINNSSNVTIVTAYYPLHDKAKFPQNKYLLWMKKLLQLNVNLIIFTTIDIVDFIKKYSNDAKIHIIIKPFEELFMWNEPYRTIWEKTWLIDPEKNKHSPELYSIWGMKPYFVCESIDRNPFNSKFFVWMDSGFIRENTILQFLSEPFSNVEKLCDPGRICFMEVYRCSDEIIENMRDISKGVSFPNLLGGGMICGDIEAWHDFRETYTRTLIDYHNRGFFVGKD